MTMFHIVLIFALPALTVAQTSQVRSSVSVFKEKVIGSESATIEDHPYQVSVQYQGKHVCGGSIISSTKVLTAAQCLYETNIIYLRVKAGSSRYDEGGTFVNVEKICTHPDYDDYIQDNDVSVLTLQCALPTTNTIQPISLIQPRISININFPATVSGWEKSSSSSKQLRKIYVRKISQQDCKDAYEIFRDITESMTCYGWPDGCEEGACRIYPGSPLAIGRILVGVLSWSRDAGGAFGNKPGIYVDLAKAIIRNHINSC